MGLHFSSSAIVLMVAFGLNACGGGGGGGNSQPSAPSAEVWKGTGVAISVLGGAPVLMPEVVAVSPGLFRLYFGQGRADGGWDIWYAESTDGLSWTVRGIALAGTTGPSDPEFIIRGASLVHLAGGQWRMYYQASPTFDQIASRFYFQTMSALSSDGVTFTREGVRLSNHHFDASSVFDQAAHARVIQLDSGMYAAYVSGKLGAPNSTGIYLCLSADGLSFQSPTLILSAGHDPYVVKSNGQYVLYVDTSPNGAFVPEALLTSADGMSWSAPSTAIFEDSTGVRLTQGPDVGGVVMPSGNLRLFTNYQISGILSFDRISP
jgi:hypothetical protein